MPVRRGAAMECPIVPVGGLVVRSVVGCAVGLALRESADWCARHGDRHCTPCGEQDGKQDQDPDAQELHGG